MRQFWQRGGAWVVAQGVLLVLAAITPWVTTSHQQIWLDSVVGAASLVVGFALLISGMLAIRKAITALPAPLASAELKTDGVFGIVRHPIYSGIIFAVWGYESAMHCVWAALIALVLFIFFDRKAAAEEDMLTARFPAYIAYRKRTRKLIPYVY